MLSRIILIVILLVVVSTSPSYAKNPVSLNITNAGMREHEVLKPYMIGFRRKLQANWRPQGEFKDAECQVRIVVGNDGRPLSRAILKSTGDTTFDESVISSIDRSMPLPHVPVPHVLIVIATFDYNTFLAKFPMNIQRFPVQTQMQPQYQSTIHRNSFNNSVNNGNLPINTANTVDGHAPVQNEREEDFQSHQETNMRNFAGNEQHSQSEPERIVQNTPPVQKEISNSELVKKFRLLSRTNWLSLSVDEQRNYAERESRWLSLPLAVRFGPIP